MSLSASDATIYAGLANGRFYRSVDKGRSWGYFNREWQKEGLIKTAFTPAISSIAISGETLYTGLTRSNLTTGGCFRSPDGGDSWAPVSAGSREQNVWSLVVSGRTVYAGTGDGVFRLEHGTDSWTQVGLAGSWVLSLAESGTASYAGTVNGVFHSIDVGNSWIDWG